MSSKIDPSALSSASMRAKLEAKRKAIVNGLARGERLGNSKMLSRVDAYEDLRSSARASSGSVWADYCKANGYSESHDAYDFFA